MLDFQLALNFQVILQKKIEPSQLTLTHETFEVLEWVIVRHLTFQFEQNSIISDQQYEFCLGYSTLDRLKMSYEDLNQISVMGLTTGLIVFDFYKPIVTVIHKIFQTKLRCLSIDRLLLQWISIILTHRCVYVEN